MKALLSISKDRYVPPYAMAIVHLGLGQYELALQWLDRCCEARDVHVVFLTIDPKWDMLRGEARFSSLLQRCGLGDFSSGLHLRQAMPCDPSI